MSLRAYVWAKEQNLPGVQKSILICIADRFNDKFGYAWPSIARIARDTGWSPRTVAKAIKELKDANLIETRQQYFSRDHSKGPNRYYIPQLGQVPPIGKKYPIHGDFDWSGAWDPGRDEGFELERGHEADA